MSAQPSPSSATGGSSTAPATSTTTHRGPPDAEAIKTRIIKHMNADHSLSLRLYLAQYAHVPLPGTTPAELVDITLEHMIITSAYGRHIIPLDPPMKSLLEARERLVTMHTACLASLDLSDVVVDRYVPPQRLWQWFVCGVCLLIFATFPFRDQLRPESGSLIARAWSVNGTAPALARLCYAVQPGVLGFMVIVHVLEAVWFARTKLRRHWVEAGSAVWWAWIGDCLLEGVGCLKRFDGVVGVKAKAKGGEKSH
ncbi:hypothetical protein A1O1_05027 [Capronia coronata CBS 617.96]|uniref:DUF2470 domain-containing protein n=1 Tax=Capronia coronata CBS 617.96 TaxID=1182541 RepID=W9Z0P6_9EURO|nr:uncharacterized protein A1O1_05027 [Capronia coronata CBS 617.96]EXJ88099.1 hypothetical protein A1O1_05027 [Capronia coronata CBS 617.96]